MHPFVLHSSLTSRLSPKTTLTMQVVVFDLEYGQPAASTTLPTSRPAFRNLLGCFGHADAGKRVLESGVDLLYTSHQVCIPQFSLMRALGQACRGCHVSRNTVFDICHVNSYGYETPSHSFIPL